MNLPNRLKKIKTNKTVLTIVIGLKKKKKTIVIGLENILCWNLVKSALYKEDSSVPVYPLFKNVLFVTLVCDVFV